MKNKMKVWLVNSNSNDDNANPNGFKFMLRQNRVATFYERVNDIDVIERGDLILLYHNENRVIAVGYAVQKSGHDFAKLMEIEHWVDVNWIWKADFDNHFKPINFIDRANLKFRSVRRSVNNITDEIDLIALLQEIGDKQNYKI